MTRTPRLLVSLAMLVCAAMGSLVPVRAADPVAAEKPAALPGLIGLTREDVIAVRGKPSGERDRGETRLMVYPDGTKIELRDGFVVSVSGGTGAEIIGADGTRYVPGADGNIQRPVQVTEVPVAADAGAGGVPSVAASTPAGALASEDEDLLSDTPPGARIELPPGSPGAVLEKHIEAMEDPEEDPPPSLAKTLLVFGIDVVFRFGLAVLVLRLALHFVGVPFFWPDLMKVALLYLAVRETMHGLGALEGLWEFIPLFKLDDAVSFLVLACSLTWFKIAGSGLTALKIAVMTKAVILGLMLAVGLAVTFGLSAMQ